MSRVDLTPEKMRVLEAGAGTKTDREVAAALTVAGHKISYQRVAQIRKSLGVPAVRAERAKAQKKRIKDALVECGSVKAAAKRLKLHPSRLSGLITKFGIREEMEIPDGRRKPDEPVLHVPQAV